MVCTEDQKCGIGLWHAVITVSIVVTYIVHTDMCTHAHTRMHARIMRNCTHY